MIWESGPWKTEIARTARKLKARKIQVRWYEASLFHIEKDVFLSTYVIRKLLEATKLSDEVESITLSAVMYKSLGRAVDIMNWHRVDELYDLSAGEPTRLSLRFFCDLVIHSFVFVPIFGPELGLAGLLVTSDWKKSEALWQFDIDELLGALTRVAEDDVVLLKTKRDEKSGEMRAVKKSNKEQPGD